MLMAAHEHVFMHTIKRNDARSDTRIPDPRSGVIPSRDRDPDAAQGRKPTPAFKPLKVSRLTEPVKPSEPVRSDADDRPFSCGCQSRIA